MSINLRLRVTNNDDLSLIFYENSNPDFGAIYPNGNQNLSSYSPEEFNSLMNAASTQLNFTGFRPLVRRLSKVNIAHHAHYDQVRKLQISLPVYLVALMVLVFFYVKKRQAYKYLFKFSKMSRIIYAYFTVKLVFSLAYFGFLIAVLEFGYENLRSPWLFFVYTVMRGCLSIAPYMLLALFSCGYGITYFDIWSERYNLRKAISMTALFSFPAAISIIEEYWYITDEDADYFFSDSVEGDAALIRGAAFAVLVVSSYHTFKDTEVYPLVKKSGAIVASVYLLKSLIVFPAPEDVFRFFVHLFMPDEFYGIRVPDIVELVSLPALMYIWRDIDGDCEVEDVESKT
ncbi:hypothetical protein JA9_002104 [Meyerozyma sp. JA9]|nr:hypothetical protein JA9_002104 [Meyerozyma sp. JA9]